MSDEVPITRRELSLQMDNLTYKLGEIIDEKLQEWEQRLHQSNIDRRNTTIRDVTGFDYADKDKIVTAIQHAHRDAVDVGDTKKEIKKAFIGYSIPFGIGAAIAWFIQQFSNTPGNP